MLSPLRKRFHSVCWISTIPIGIHTKSSHDTKFINHLQKKGDWLFGISTYSKDLPILKPDMLSWLTSIYLAIFNRHDSRSIKIKIIRSTAAKVEEEMVCYIELLPSSIALSAASLHPYLFKSKLFSEEDEVRDIKVEVFFWNFCSKVIWFYVLTFLEPAENLCRN